MSDTQNMNFSLLTQPEIDTLVRFLLEQKEGVNSSVLSQESIDKLIELLRFDERRRKRAALTGTNGVEGALAKVVTIRRDEEDVCELSAAIDAESDFVKLYVTNQNNGQQMEITPEMLNEGDGACWGRCISPLLLNKVAVALRVKYTTETHEAVCARYAECMFGDASHKLPLVYMPGDAEMLENLL